MPYPRYLTYDIFGGVFWATGLILLSYFLGRTIPNITERVHYVIAVVILLSVLPAIISVLRARRSRGHNPGSHKFSNSESD